MIPCPGGGDTELAVDGAGRLYFNDLSLANFSVSRSDDQGRSFITFEDYAVAVLDELERPQHVGARFGVAY